MLGFMKSDAYPIDGLEGTESNPDPAGALVTVSRDADYPGDLTPDPGHHLPDVNLQIFGNREGSGSPAMQGFVQAYKIGYNFYQGPPQRPLFLSAVPGRRNPLVPSLRAAGGRSDDP